LGSNSWEREDLTALLDMVAAGRLRPAIDRTFPLTEAQEALRLIEDREVFGKVIVEP
jgi:alcohol dehydrogenase